MNDDLKDDRLGDVFISLPYKPQQQGRVNEDGSLSCGNCKELSDEKAVACLPDGCPCCGLICCPHEHDYRSYEKFGEPDLFAFSCSDCSWAIFKGSPLMAKALNIMMEDHPDWEKTGMHLFRFLEERNRFIIGAGRTISDGTEVFLL